MWSVSDGGGIGWALGRSIPAGVSLLDREEAKRHLRITHADSDTYLDQLLPAVENLVEQDLNRSLLSQTWQLTFDYGFPASRVVQLPMPPLLAVTSIAYTDEAGDAQTFSNTLYHTRNTGDGPGAVALNEGEVWPQVSSILGAVVFTYTAGYGTKATDVPPALKALMWLMTAHFYEQREPVVTGTIATRIPLSYQRLLYQFRNTEF